MSLGSNFVYTLNLVILYCLVITLMSLRICFSMFYPTFVFRRRVDFNVLVTVTRNVLSTSKYTKYLKKYAYILLLWVWLEPKLLTPQDGVQITVPPLWKLSSHYIYRFYCRNLLQNLLSSASPPWATSSKAAVSKANTVSCGSPNWQPIRAQALLRKKNQVTSFEIKCSLFLLCH